MAALSGNATAIHSRTAASIARVLASILHKIQVLFIATDGDKGYNSAYNSQFRFWFHIYVIMTSTHACDISGGRCPYMELIFST
jgi:hypothetical protein